MAVKIGRPKAYSTTEAFTSKVQDYFDTITMDMPMDLKNNKGEDAIETIYLKPPSIMALCNHLGITSETLGQYGKDPMFSEAITCARQLILERKLEMLTIAKNPRGIMFDLSANYGMVEKKAVETSGEQTIKIDVEYTDD